MLRSAAQHRSCARSGDRGGSWGPSQTFRHDALVLVLVGHGANLQQYERYRLPAQAGQHDNRTACAEAAIGVGIQAGNRRGAVNRRGKIDVCTDDLMVRPGSIVAVSMRVIVTATGQGRQVVIGAKRIVRHERKRGHDRQAGREALGQQSDVTNHTDTDSRCVGKILVAEIVTVQTGQSYKSGRTARICGTR